MNKEEIKNILPHREPMLLVDKAEVLEDGSAKGEYTIKGDEFFLQGHFPGNAVVPGVILCEMMAQTCAVLLAGKEENRGATPYFTSMDKVKFRKPVVQGDTLQSICKIVRHKGPFYFAEGKGTVDGKRVVTASFSFAVVKPEDKNQL